jgi:hypothetical protein
MKAPQRVIIANNFSGMRIFSNLGTGKFCSYSQIENRYTLINHLQIFHLKKFGRSGSYGKASCTARFQAVRINKALAASLIVLPLILNGTGKVIPACGPQEVTAPAHPAYTIIDHARRLT